MISRQAHCHATQPDEWTTPRERLTAARERAREWEHPVAAQRTSTSTPAVVERRIYFYRIDAGTDAAGRPLSFDPLPLCVRINALPFTPEGRYWQDGDGNATCCWVDRDWPTHRLRFGHIRRLGLPQVERGGALSALRIPAASGLVEQVHIVFFPNQIIGSEFNFYAPRIPRLAQYLAAKAGDLCPGVAFEPLLRQDVAEQLSHLRDVRLMRLRIRASYAAQVARADEDLGSAFKAAQRAGDAEELEIALKSLPHSRRPLAERLLTAVKQLASLEDLRSEASRFEIKGLSDLTGKVEQVDILSDQLIARGQIICLDTRTRALNPESAYAAIEQAYAALRDQLVVAAGLRV
jgi:hypothetical protein